ncbi:cobalamin ABC transporter ATP-binding protein [Brachybacterium alimentarium]|uniref:Mycobactin import ATP-binding/permease protein IrtA n=1 Tax=Brachybacterium alimentarium TaxID=47845 RepID=A0A2A3YNK7_9MICO|nr:SIP domain-containing protein [Brachybacterium alimentarium]PCC40946.1 cobalamin ABC transporter ATP-binding protein [Brachybacterium alimentarium]
MALIEARNLHLAYDRHEVVRDLDLTLPEGLITIIVGANGCGKSTVLRGLSRLMTPRGGSVVLDGKELQAFGGKDLARRLGLLPQSPLAPDGVTVRELIARGRFPHQGLFPQWRDDDERAVQEALEATSTVPLQDRPVAELSGGQRQRVWIAMALAQQTDVLLLDEPTTFLDLTHQLDVLDVVRDLNRERGTTIGIVLHDLNLAARYADHLIAVKDGRIHTEGPPRDVITAQMVHDVFALDARIVPDSLTGTPMVLPHGRGNAHHDASEEDAMTTLITDPAASVSEQLPALENSSMLAFDLTVAARKPLGSTLVRFTFTSPDLVHFGTNSHPLDMRIKMVIPGPEASADHFAGVRPGAMADPTFFAEWYRQWLQIDPRDRGWMRTYTVRDFRAAGHPGNVSEHPEIDVDFVLHLEPEQAFGSGVAAHWAHHAEVGDTVSMLGPNKHLVGPDYGGIEFRPGTARTVLLVGDETALPAIGSILESLPASITGHALVEIPDASDEQHLLTRSGVQVRWLPREGRPHGELLSAEVKRLMSEDAQAFHAECPDGDESPVAELEDVDVDSSILWETSTGHGAFYAWLAGEAGVIKSLRRHLVSELGLDRKQVSFMGYWRTGRPEH